MLLPQGIEHEGGQRVLHVRSGLHRHPGSRSRDFSPAAAEATKLIARIQDIGHRFYQQFFARTLAGQHYCTSGRGRVKQQTFEEAVRIMIHILNSGYEFPLWQDLGTVVSYDTLEMPITYSDCHHAGEKTLSTDSWMRCSSVLHGTLHYEIGISAFESGFGDVYLAKRRILKCFLDGWNNASEMIDKLTLTYNRTRQL
ncbi:ATP synthase subunit gamma, mitochondrial-like [Penaeus monodon]|uniref:ATP synthase subunit gamma, mitochondrial-like n=1 Tax=Penaeus monodon TaxID=6687 RepID=UPI0018A7D113|nr:ATP synthase subunit gamma, mitochondrial-like [Penaeus monodon]